VIPFYQEAKDLYKIAAQYWNKLSRDKIEEQFQLTQKCRENPHLYEFLKWKYGNYNILEWLQNIYPVVVFPAPGHQHNVNSALTYPLTKEEPKAEAFVVREPAARVLLEKLGVPIQNRLTYTMARLNTQDKLQLTGALGCYFYALDTCYSLEWEILSNLNTLDGHNEDDFKRFDDKLKLRKKLHENVNYPIVDGSGRSAAIGISTLIAYNDNGKINLWLKRRSKKDVAIHGGLVHVIPSFTFQPVTEFVEDEFKISHNVFREYLEEIFDEPEPQMGTQAAYNYFYNDPRLQDLHTLIGSQQAELLFTGIALDPKYVLYSGSKPPIGSTVTRTCQMKIGSSST
jgi:hypothetical protein